MNEAKIIKSLSSSNSRLFKEEILLNEMKNQNNNFFHGLTLAYNRLLTFGVKKIPESKINGSGIRWEEFERLSNKLINRSLTGHAARDEIIDLMEKSLMDEWNFFYKRILQKDMRCGLSEKTINNVAKKNGFENYIIPVFACQLAQDSESHKKKIVGKKFVEIKLDGVRAIFIVYPSGKIDIFSRNGKELNNFENIKKEMQSLLNFPDFEDPFVLDGEIISKNFQELMKQIHRKESIQNPDAKLYLFDLLPLKNFNEGIYESKYSERIHKLKLLYNKYFESSETIRILKPKLIDLDTNAGINEFKEFNRESIFQGYEGIMIKDPESFYECKRSTTWLKSKPFIEVSLSVKNYEEGSGRNQGKLGALIAEGHENGKFFKLNIGSGFSDEQREEFWRNKEELIGKIVEIRADSISKSKDGEYWSLRFPRFKSFRGFEKNEKL